MDSSLDEAQPLQLSVVIDGRLDGGRAHQVATLASRLGLAGVWLRLPWWPLAVPSGLGADEADAGWLGRLVAVPADLRIALTGTPATVARWQEVIGRRPDLAVSQLVLPPGCGTAPLAVFVPCAPFLAATSWPKPPWPLPQPRSDPLRSFLTK